MKLFLQFPAAQVPLKTYTALHHKLKTPIFEIYSPRFIPFSVSGFYLRLVEIAAANAAQRVCCEMISPVLIVRRKVTLKIAKAVDVKNIFKYPGQGMVVRFIYMLC